MDHKSLDLDDKRGKPKLFGPDKYPAVLKLNIKVYLY